jgi:hypothetical protein
LCRPQGAGCDVAPCSGKYSMSLHGVHTCARVTLVRGEPCGCCSWYCDGAVSAGW